MVAASFLHAAMAVAAPSTCVTQYIEEGGAYYSSNIRVGQPALPMRVIADTGSYDLLLDSTFCSQVSCAVHTRYDAFNSTTASDPADPTWTAATDEPVPGRAVKTAYGSGTVTSIAWSDLVGIGAPPVNGSATDMLLMLEQEIENFGNSYNFDGIMGLGRGDSTVSAVPQTALLTNLGVDHFTMCLGSTDLDNDEGGRLELNEGPLERLAAPSFVDVPLVGTSSWATSMTSAGVADLNITTNFSVACPSLDGGASDAFCPTLIDSGTTLLTFPTDLLQGLLAAIEMACPNCLENLQKQETCDGVDYEGLPPLTFTLGGSTVSLDRDVYMVATLVDDVPTADSKQHGDGAATAAAFAMPHMREAARPLYSAPAELRHSSNGVRCMPLFASNDMASSIGNLVILGMPFLRQYAVRFTRDMSTTAPAGMSLSRLDAIGQVECAKCPADYTHMDTIHDISTGGEHPVNAPPQKEGTPKLPGRRSSRRKTAAAAALEPHVLSAATTPSPRARKQHLRSSKFRLPWYAVHPALRPAHAVGSAHAKGYNASAVQAMRDGRFRWKFRV